MNVCDCDQKTIEKTDHGRIGIEKLIVARMRIRRCARDFKIRNPKNDSHSDWRGEPWAGWRGGLDF
jgi:hypothetical protein